MGVPAAHVHKADLVARLHQPRHAPGRALKALGAQRIAAGGFHLALHGAGHFVAGGKAFVHRRGQRCTPVHGGDEFGLPRIHTAPPGACAQRGVGHIHRPAQHQGQGAGKRHGLQRRCSAIAARVQLGHQPVQKARSVVAPPAQGLAQLDAVLRVEVAAREVVRARKRHKRELTLLVQRQHRFRQCRVQAPVGCERQGAALLPRPGDGDVGPRLVVVAAGRRHQQAGAVVATAQEHQQKARVLRAGCGEHAGAVHAQA